MSALHDPGLAIGETRMELVPRGVHVRMHVQHQIRQIAPLTGRGFVLDLARCPFILDDIRCSRSSRIYQSRGGLVVEPDAVELPGASLEYSLDWDPTGSGAPQSIRFLRFPDDLPICLSELDTFESATAFALGPWKIVCDELLRGVTVAGVLLRPADESGGPLNSFFRGFIVSDDLIAERSASTSATTLVTCAGLELLGPRDRHHLNVISDEPLSFLSTLFGRAGSNAVLIAGPGDRDFGEPTFGGPALLLDKQFSAKLPPGSFGMRFEMIGDLCSIYWGSGCHILGGAAAELTAAIGGAVALSWAQEHTNSQYVSQAITAFEKLASRSRFHNRMDTAFGKLSSRMVGELSLKMYNKMHDEHYRKRLSQITDNFWGMHIPYGVALRELLLSV